MPSKSMAIVRTCLSAMAIGTPSYLPTLALAVLYAALRVGPLRFNTQLMCAVNRAAMAVGPDASAALMTDSRPGRKAARVLALLAAVHIRM